MMSSGEAELSPPIRERENWCHTSAHQIALSVQSPIHEHFKSLYKTFGCQNIYFNDF